MSGKQDAASASTSGGPPPPPKGSSGQKNKPRRGKPAKNKQAIKNAKIGKITTKPAEVLAAPEETEKTVPEAVPTEVFEQVAEVEVTPEVEETPEVEKNTAEVKNTVEVESKPGTNPTKLKLKNRKKRNQKTRHAKVAAQAVALAEPVDPKPGSGQPKAQAEPEPDAGEPQEPKSYSKVAQVEPEPDSAQPKAAVQSYSAVVKPLEERMDQVNIDAGYPESDSDSNDFSSFYPDDTDDDDNYWDQDYDHFSS